MNLEQELKNYGRKTSVPVREQHIKETVKASMDRFCSCEQRRLLTRLEFLWEQFSLLQKRWWYYQAMLLFLLWVLLLFLKDVQIIQRLTGVGSSLFIILMIPELWKNRSSQSMEIEAASYYSLRQIYAARMLLFGIVDMALITVFCRLSSAALGMSLSQLLVQFLLPMTVTACICFRVLCSPYPFSEAAAVFLCMLWNAVWVLLVLDEKIYEAITFPLWLFFSASALFFFALTVYRTLSHCNLYWEDADHETDF